MARVLNGVLTSKVNAGSLHTGDEIIHDGRRKRITSTRRLGNLGLFVIFTYDNEPGPWHWNINEPLNRVAGSRTAGQI